MEKNYDRPVATTCICNTLSLSIYDIEYGVNDYAIVKFSNETKFRRVKMNYGKNDFIRVCGTRYDIKDFMKV